jgi:uncharacterized protein YecT (DUF1311 family)
MIRVLFVTFAIAFSTNSIAQTASDDPQADADAICKSILATSPPAHADAGSFKPGCDSSAYYFGIGRPKDFVAARHCAYAELTKPSSTNSNIFACPGVLSMIYANGEGTPRNTALARRFVCEAWSAPAELHIRLDLLDQIDKSTKPPHFDLCDTATSGLSEGWCQSINSKSSRVERDRKIKQLTSTLSPPAQKAFAALQKAESAYEDTRARNEVDLSGTGRAAFEFQEEDSVADEFLANLRSLNQPPPSTGMNPRAADQQLNLAYASVREKLPAKAGEPFSSRYGTIGFDGVQKTERAWLQLRDRWMDFIHVAYPSYPSNIFLAKITSQRTQQLNSLVQ